MINKGGVSYKGSTWHRECFSCQQCSKVLAGDKFLSNDDKPYCVDCYGDLFAKKCNTCKKPITGTAGGWLLICFVFVCSCSLLLLIVWSLGQ